MSDFLKEIKDFYRFFKLPKSKKQLTFYSEQASYFAYFEGLISELIKRGQSVCYVTSDSHDPILKENSPQITPLYVNKLLAFFMPLVDCQVMVMTLTDLDNYHLKRSKNPVHYVYVFHAMVSTHMVYNENAFNNYDSILCVGPHHFREIRREEEIKKLKPKNLVKTGYYRLERIYDNFKKYQKNDDKKTILIAPSWGKDNIIESCGKKLIEALLQSDWQVILRPHPETLKRSAGLVKEIEVEFKVNPNFIVERSVQTDDSLMKADVLISDYSGIVMEYSLGTERPVISIDVPPKVHNEHFKDLGLEPLELAIRSQVGVVIPLAEIASIPKIISMLTSEAEVYRKKIVEIRGQNVYAFGQSSQIGAEYLMSLLSKVQ